MRKLLLAGVGIIAALALSAPALAVPPDPVIVSGFVTDTAGGEVVGATVELYQDPAGEGAMTLSPIATTVSTLDGYFSMVLPMSQVYIDEANANGMANFEVVTNVGTAQIGYFAISRIPDPIAGTWLAESTAGGEVSAARSAARNRVSTLISSAASPYQDASNVPIRVRMRGSAAKVQAAAANLQARRSTSAATAATSCITTKTTVAATNQWGVVGQLHVERDTNGWAVYGTSADTDMGVGVSVNGSTAWSLSGTRHVGNNHSASVTYRYNSTNSAATFGRKLETNFRMLKRKHQLWCPFLASTWYVARVDNWRSGQQWGDNQSTFNNKCQDQFKASALPYLPNGGFDRVDRNFTTYTLGMQVFGANLTTQSGASRYVHLHSDFGNDYARYWLCGSNAAPPSAGRIYAAP